MLQGFRNDTIVITDTICLILLDKLNVLEILPAMFRKIFTTPQIAAEFGPTLPKWIKRC